MLVDRHVATRFRRAACLENTTLAKSSGHLAHPQRSVVARLPPVAPNTARVTRLRHTEHARVHATAGDSLFDPDRLPDPHEQLRRERVQLERAFAAAQMNGTEGDTRARSSEITARIEQQQVMELPAWRVTAVLPPGCRDLLSISVPHHVVFYEGVLATPNRLFVHLFGSNPEEGRDGPAQEAELGEIGVLCECVMAEAAPDNRLHVVVAALARVRITHAGKLENGASVQATLEPDREEVLVAGGNATVASAAALAWARIFETHRDSMTMRFNAYGGIRASIMSVVCDKEFFLGGVAGLADAAKAAWIAAQASGGVADNNSNPAANDQIAELLDAEAGVRKALKVLEEQRQRAKAMLGERPLPPFSSRALAPITFSHAAAPAEFEAPPKWPAVRRAARLSHALAVALVPEVSKDEGRMQLLAIPSATARLREELEVLNTRSHALSTLIALLGVDSDVP
eukprot:gnl/TRDRNA2_/TRDRNA2_91527_c0_seq1.p1 gnl/TRDRNA2_/TRDRNA2_91527_c0~~gnl/TRDRNA2_/TRDRNA2_91527_c0_seq1.p1  ORF type:complete len:520 (-),score=103.13 gnl/TRDRNA2_/TRDRNA2_91527_c0_seq1:5-1378(-)